MKVTLLIENLSQGGAQKVLLTLAEALHARGISVDVVCACGGGARTSEVPAGVDLREFHLPPGGVKWVPPAIAKFSRYLREAEPDAVLSFVGLSNLVAALARRIARSRTHLVVTEHSQLSKDMANSRKLRRHLMPYVMRLAYSLSDQVVAVSHGMADDLSKTTGFPRGRIRVIHNPVVTDKLLAHGGAPGPGRSARAALQICAAGRLTRQKDFPTLLRAFAHLKGMLPGTSLRLVVLGEGEHRQSLQDLARSLDIAGEVEMPGFTANPYPIIAASDLFVLSSAWEGFGVVLVEAMALGCPVVSTDCPSGPSEILAAGRFGPLTPVGDPLALARAMRATLLEPPDRSELVRRAGNFHVDTVVQEYLEELVPA